MNYNELKEEKIADIFQRAKALICVPADFKGSDFVLTKESFEEFPWNRFLNMDLENFERSSGVYVEELVF